VRDSMSLLPGDQAVVKCLHPCAFEAGTVHNSAVAVYSDTAASAFT
jgi:hypothetical protein